MHTGKRFSPLEFFNWTRRSVLWMLLLALLPTVAYFLGATFIALPWQPLTIIGTAVAFIVGFKNNASYNRLWEARQIYGAIINDSRSFGYTLRDALGTQEKNSIHVFFNRHFAWLTALRYQLREPRTWENMGSASNEEYQQRYYQIPERQIPIQDELSAYLPINEVEYILSKKNKATQLLAQQSKELASLYAGGLLNDFQWNKLQTSLNTFTDHQGKAERIKNFPYPRNFASIATYLLFLFIILVPFGLLREFDSLGSGTLLEGYSVWFNIPFSAILMWAFHTLDTVGESSVNPFEGSANDVPITQISRTIEIDMLDMLDHKELPKPIIPVHNIVL